MITRVEVSSGVVARMDSEVNCRSCRGMINVERLFVAKAMIETPELLTFLCESDRLGITSLEQAQMVSEGLDVTNPNRPIVRCESCGGENNLAISRYNRSMEVPPFLWCRCGQEVDLRYPGDRERVRFMGRFPFMPFLVCRNCKKRMLLPPLGKDVWRMPVFHLMNLFREMF